MVTLTDREEGLMREKKDKEKKERKNRKEKGK